MGVADGYWLLAVINEDENEDENYAVELRAFGC